MMFSQPTTAQQTGPWKPKPIPIAKLDEGIAEDLPKFAKMLPTMYKADRRCYEYQGGQIVQNPGIEPVVLYYYFAGVVPSNLKFELGDWSAGIVVRQVDYDQEIKKKNKSKINLNCYNPISGRLAGSKFQGAPSELVSHPLSDLIAQTGCPSLVWSEYQLPSNQTDPNSNVYKLVKKASSLPVATETIYIDLALPARQAFRFSQHIYMDLTTMRRLMSSAEVYFQSHSDVPFRDETGQPISVKIDDVMNSRQYKTNSFVWLEVFTTSTAPSSYRPPRTINPGITLYLVHESNSLISKQEFEDIVKAIDIAKGTPAEGTKLLTGYEMLDSKTAENGYYHVKFPLCLNLDYADSVRLEFPLSANTALTLNHRTCWLGCRNGQHDRTHRKSRSRMPLKP